VRRAAAAVVLACALAAHAQTPPDNAPPPPEPAAAPASEPAAPAEAAATATMPTEHAPPSKAAAAPKAVPRAPAAAPPDNDREAQVTALREEVGRLQSALDAERAAASPPEETAPVPQPATGLWGWLALAAGLGLAAGFVLGWRVLDRRMRRKFGGLRIF
jgi:hypothetical protein